MQGYACTIFAAEYSGMPASLPTVEFVGCSLSIVSLRSLGVSQISGE
jgi:hypothetical protein